MPSSANQLGISVYRYPARLEVIFSDRRRPLIGAWDESPKRHSKLIGVVRRVGSQKMADMLVRWTQSGVPESQYRADIGLIDELSQAMNLTSIYGLGQIAPAPIQSALKHFRGEIDAHVLQGQCPSGICFTPASRAGEAQRVGIRQ